MTETKITAIRMVAAPVQAQSSSGSGPRPANRIRDERAVYDLLNRVFERPADEEGQRVWETGRSYHHSPLRWQWRQLTSGLVPGFVWEEYGRIVGNVSLFSSDESDRYLIANVAVHPDYRRQGIARSLMAESISYLQSHEARVIMLQVEADNTAALNLYYDLGFESLGDMTTWQLSSGPFRELPPVVNSGGIKPTIRPLRRSEWHAAYRLDSAGLDPERNWPQPLTRNAYRTGFWRWLENFVNGRQAEHWVIADAKERLVGLATILTEIGKRHLITVRVNPEWHGLLERPLLAKTLRLLNYPGHSSIRVDHPAEDQVMNTLLMEARFRPRRTLKAMRLGLSD